MTVLYPNLCYNEVCYKGTAVYPRGGGGGTLIFSCVGSGHFFWFKVLKDL